MRGGPVDLLAQHLPAGETTPYERLLADAIRGDSTLFVREDSVEAAWRVVEPVLDEATTVQPYAPGTWGPGEASRLVTEDGGWHAPALDVA
jgi:glucose-6-phosphate 1-dehydrogenase